MTQEGGLRWVYTGNDMQFWIALHTAPSLVAMDLVMCAKTTVHTSICCSMRP